MSTVNLQDAPITIGNPIEIERACNEIRLDLAAGLPWLSHPYFIAERFARRKGSRLYYFPETYSRTPTGDPNETPAEKYPYHRLTPDNDFSGMCFFYIRDMRNLFTKYSYNYLQYRVALIFSVNLHLIDQAKLEQGLFTQELIRDARRILTTAMAGKDFQWSITEEIRDLREVFREFTLDDIEAYNRAPLQCFRFNLLITVKEDCP